MHLDWDLARCCGQGNLPAELLGSQRGRLGCFEKEGTNQNDPHSAVASCINIETLSVQLQYPVSSKVRFFSPVPCKRSQTGAPKR